METPTNPTKTSPVQESHPKTTSRLGFEAALGKLAEAADALFAGKCAWVCTACGARGIKWQMEPDTADKIAEAVRRSHVQRAPKCTQPVISVTFEDVDAAKLLGTPAAAIRASVEQRVGLPAPPADDIVRCGPWATPDMFRCSA